MLWERHPSDSCGHALPRVAVLMCTFNGARFLEEQLASLGQQIGVFVDIYASDDRSSDRTVDLLKMWQLKWKKGAFEIFTGPAKGFAENFRSLSLRAEIKADYVAFCDQDDIWDDNKLSVAVSTLAGDADQPALYCGRSRLVDR